MAKLSRRKLAGNAAARLASGEPKKAVLRDVAAYLIDSRRTSEATLVVRDIEAMLLDAGTAIGTVTSARTLSRDSIGRIETFIKANDARITRVVLRESIDENLIGGFKIELPGAQLDASVKAKLDMITV